AGQGTPAGDGDARAPRPGAPHPERRDLSRRSTGPDIASAGRRLERFRPDARHGSLRAPPGGGVRLIRSPPYAAALAAGADRMAARRLQSLLRADLPAWAY